VTEYVGIAQESRSCTAMTLPVSTVNEHRSIAKQSHRTLGEHCRFHRCQRSEDAQRLQQKQRFRF